MIRLQVTAIDLDPALCAFKFHAVTRAVACHSHSVGVFVCKHLEILAVRRNYLNGPAVFTARPPLGNVEMVCSPVGHLTAGVITPRHPPQYLWMKGPPRRLPQPDIIIQPIRRFPAGRQIANAGWSAHIHRNMFTLTDL